MAVLVVMVIVFAIKQQDPVTDNSSDTTVSTSSRKNPAAQRSPAVTKRSILLPAHLMKPITTPMIRIPITYQILRRIHHLLQRPAHPVRRLPTTIIRRLATATAAIKAAETTVTLVTVAAATAVQLLPTATRNPHQFLAMVADLSSQMLHNSQDL